MIKKNEILLLFEPYVKSFKQQILLYFKMPAKQIVVLPDSEDIMKFIGNTRSKSENDSDNKIRENIIKNMSRIDDEYFQDPTYGVSWCGLKQKFDDSLKVVCPSFCKYIIKHKAGRSNNYDYMVSFFDTDEEKIQETKLEFKYNASTIDEAPQFVSPMKPSQYLSSSFEDYYYDCFLVHLLQKFDIQVPDKAIYLKSIHSNKPLCMAASQLLYYQGCKQSSKYTGDEKAVSFYESANTVSKECIKNFIQNTDLDIKKLTQYLLESQKEKVYLLYKNDNFHIQTTCKDDYIIESYVKNPEKFRYEAVSKSHKKITILLRWKNGNGIAYPAFQIS
jgi:hypothetical protein